MMEEGAGQRPVTSIASAAEGNAAANRVIFYSQAYTALMEQAHAAMPSETVGVLLGDTQVAPAGKLWVTVADLAAIQLASNDTVEARLDRLRHLIERLGRYESSRKVVGWFYSDPGTGLFPPRLPLVEIQRIVPENATLFLLANPATDQGAFFWWDGTAYSEADGFYEAVPDESFSPIATWDGEIRGAKAWFGALLAVAPRSPYGPAPSADALIIQADDEEGDSYSVPVYVEVITEEPVEYVAPDTTSFPAESEAPVSTETQPYPVQPEADMAETTDVDDIAEVAEYIPAQSGASTNHLGSLTSKLDPDERPPEAVAPPDDESLHTEDSPDPMGPSTNRLGSLTGKLDPGERPPEAVAPPDDEPPYAENTSAQTGPLGPAIAATLATPDEETPTEDHTAERATGEQVTPGEEEHQSEPIVPAQLHASTVLAPVARSPIRPVMKGRDWREVVFSVLGLVAVAIILILLMGGLPTQQNDPSPASPPAVNAPAFNQDNAQAGNASNAATAIPGATVTITVTSAPQPPAIEPAQTPPVP